MSAVPQVGGVVEPVLKLNYLSHGTLECRDIEATRKFYTEFLGLQVIRTSPISLLIRLGGTNTIAVVEMKKKQTEVMPMIYHNGLDVETQAEVDECHRLVTEHAAKWDMKKVTKPVLQHGTYSFYLWDLDDNCWEILTNPPGGYSWLFEHGDQSGKGHLDRNFKRPGMA